MSIWVDGRYLPPAAAPAADAGALAPFETMGARDSAVPLWERHLVRLAATARHLGLPFAEPLALRGAAATLLLHNGDADGVLRLSLVPRAAAVHTVMTTRSRGPHLSYVRLLPTVVERPAGAPPADHKLLPRTFYDAVLQQAQDGSADDGIVIAADGSVLETAVGNLWLLLDGVWTTPDLDGRVLPGIARRLLLERARATALPVAERRCDLGDLHRAQALATSNAVHGPRAAQLLGSGPAAVAIVDSTLAVLWRAAPPGSSPA